MKKYIALLLAVLILLMAACGKEPEITYATPDTPTTSQQATHDEPTGTQPTTQPVTQPTTLANDLFDPEASAPILGRWVKTVSLGGEIFNLTDMEETVEMTFVYQLNADGTYYRGIDDYHNVITAYGDAVERFMLDRLYATFTAEKLIEGVSKKKIPTLWEETEKANAEEQAKRFLEGLYLDYRFSQLNGYGDFYEADGMIWFSLEDRTYEPCGYTLSEEGLTITEVAKANLYKQLGFELPLLLTKA